MVNACKGPFSESMCLPIAFFRMPMSVVSHKLLQVSCYKSFSRCRFGAGLLKNWDGKTSHQTSVVVKTALIAI